MAQLCAITLLGQPQAATAAVLQSAETVSQTASVVPHVLQYSGQLPTAAMPQTGAAVSLVFSVYAEQSGGDALWTETHMVTPDAEGKYTVLLGATLPAGVPQSAFADGRSRWVGVTPATAAGELAELPRTPITAAAYALKATDAETVGGHPASDFKLQPKNADGQPLGTTDISTIVAGQGIDVTNAGTGPSVTLSVDANYLTQVAANCCAGLGVNNTFTGSNNFNGNLTNYGTPVMTSLAAQPGIVVTPRGSNWVIGLDQPYFATVLNSTFARLDGTNAFTAPITFASGQTFPNTISSITAGTGITASTTAGAAIVGVDTTVLNATYAQLAQSNNYAGTQSLAPLGLASTTAGYSSNPLQFTADTWNSAISGRETHSYSWQAEPIGNNTTSPSATMNLLFADEGSSPEETGLSIASNGIINFATGQTFPGAGSGSGASLTGNDTFTGTDSFTNPVTFANSQTFPNTISSITAGTDITATTTAGVTTVGVNTTALNSTYAQLAAANTFTGPTLFKSVEAIEAQGTASAILGYSSNSLEFLGSAYNSTTSVPESLTYIWRLEPSGNDTASPTGTMNLLYGAGSTPPAETGLSIASNGIINFATGQTFPGAGGSGGATLSGNNTFTGNDTFTNPVTFANSQTFPNTISGITAGTDITATTASGVTTVGVNEASLETDLNSTYAQLGASNAFTQPITFANSQTFPGTVATSTANTFTATQSLGATAAATSSSGASSNPLLFSASDWDTGVEGPQAASFQWQAEPVGSNTGSPSGSMNLLFGYGSATPAETGLSIAGNGIINFATGQTFPGAGSGSGASLTGNDTFTGTDSFTNPVTFANSQTFPNTISSITAGADITATTTAGVTTVGVNTTALNSTYAQLAAANTFTGPTLFKSVEAIEAQGTASAILGYSSNSLEFLGSAYNSTTSVPESLTYIWRLEPSGNDTASPTGTMNLLYGAGSTPPAETGLSIASNGIINFATGQTFPGAGSGSGASLSGNDTFTGTDTFTNPVTFANSQTFPNTISSITAGTDITASTTSGVTTVGVNTSALETTLDSRYAQTGANNYFSAPQVFDSTAFFSSSVGLGGAVTAYGPITFYSGQTFPNTISSITAGTDITATTTSGVTAVGVNEAALESDLNANYAQLGVANTFTAGQSLGTTGTATGSAAYSSWPVVFSASDYDPGPESAETANFLLQAEPVGSNSNSPSGSLNLLYGYGSATPAETGLSIASNGIINFATGQTFPGAGGSGGASLSGNNTFTGSNTFTNPVTFSNSQIFPNVAYTNSLNNFLSQQYFQAAVHIEGELDSTGLANFSNIASATFTNPVTFANNQTFPGTIAANTNVDFTGADSFEQNLSLNGGLANYGTENLYSGLNLVNGTANMNGSDFQVNSTAEFYNTTTFNSAAYFYNGAAFNSLTTNSADIYGLDGLVTISSTDTSTTPIAPAIITMQSTDGFSTALASYAEGGAGIGVAGLADPSGGSSSESTPFIADSNGAGVWADSSGPAGSPALLATSDNSTAGFFANAGTGAEATVYIENDESVSSTSGYLLNAYSPNGSCQIDNGGDLSCSGTVSSVVQANDRKVASFGVQSSENWLEDFGSGQLSSGSAHIALDPTFAATINASVEYHVFLTPRGDSEGLYVASSGPEGFEVRESRHGRGSIAFDYRIVAHPKGHETERLTDVTAKMEALKPRPRDFTMQRPAMARPAASFTPLPPQSAQPEKMTPSQLPHKLTPVAQPTPTKVR